MAKEAYYFSHDANARQDPKILAMMSVYEAKGYGWYWIIVEMLREQSDFTLDMQGKYTFNALAMQMHSTKEEAKEFVEDCVNEFELFESDGQKFWSNSLLRRMAMKEEVSMKRKKAAEARWGKQKDSNSNAEDMQMHSKEDANAMQGKEKKVKESKGKENIYTSEFDEFWDLYPVKKGKHEAALKFKTKVNQDGLDVIMNGLQAAIEEYDSDPKNAGNNYQYFVQAPRFLNKKVYMDYQEKAKPKKTEKTAEQLQAKKIRDLMQTYELGLDYWENIDGSPEIYHEAVKELKELGQL